MDRAPTGIAEFDALVEGGFPRGSTTLLTGAPGTGKSIFALQYLYNGIMSGDNGIYVYTESFAESIREQARQIGIDIEKLEQQGKIALLSVPIEKKKFDLLYVIAEWKKKINAKRIVFDSLATFTLNLDLLAIPLGFAGSIASSVSIDARSNDIFRNFDEESMPEKAKKPNEKIYYRSNPEKRMIYLVIETLRNLGTTNLIITFSSQGGRKITVDGVSEYVSDGIIVLYNELIGAKHIRTMSILKMRNTNHSQYIHDFEITGKGMVIKPAEQVYK